VAAEEDKKLGVFSLDLRKAMIIFLISLLLFATPAMAQKASESATQTGAMTKIYIAYCQNQKAMTERACKMYRRNYRPDGARSDGARSDVYGYPW